MEEVGVGLGVRRATEADAEQIVALGVAAHGADEEAGIRHLLARPDVGPSQFTVVVDADRVVSSLCLIPVTLEVSGVEVPAGQVEYVATAPGHRRRGLVRAQIGRVHGWSAARGDLVQCIAGLPYFYRRFGYEYAIGWPRRWQLRADAGLDVPTGWRARPATSADRDALIGLHTASRVGADIRLVRVDADWRFMLSRPDRLTVVERDGVVGGYFRSEREHGRLWLYEVVCASLDAARALLAAACASAGAGNVDATDRPGTPLSAVLADSAQPLDRPDADYARVADPVALLDRLRPALSARLAASAFAAEAGELVVSTYGGGFAVGYDGGAVTGVRAVDGVEDPGPEILGVPPDLVATLLLGRHDVDDLARCQADVHLGRRRAIARTLFPRLRADVVAAV